MAVFAYKGMNATGKPVKGKRDADSVKAARAALKRDGVFVTELLEENQASRVASKDIDFGRFFRRVTTTDVALATRQLAVLVRSGVPLVEALGALAEQVDKPALQEAYTAVRNRVNEGSSFADALRAHPEMFASLYVNMVAAGEASGALEAVLERLADFLDAQSKLQGKVAGALAYPAFMGVVTLGTVTMMMTVVVPKVTSVFADFGAELPWYTRLLIFTSDTMVGYWWLILPAIVGGVVAFRRWLATEKGRARWDARLLAAPVLGQLVLRVAVARFARTLATLLRSGVPVLSALDITRNVLGNVVLMGHVETARESVREGEGLAKPLKASNAFPPLVTHMIAVGERTGQLEEMLENIATAYDQQVDVQVTAMTSLLEPLIIVIMGGITAGIAFAMLMPLLQLNEFVQ